MGHWEQILTLTRFLILTIFTVVDTLIFFCDKLCLKTRYDLPCVRHLSVELFLGLLLLILMYLILLVYFFRRFQMENINLLK